MSIVSAVNRSTVHPARRRATSRRSVRSRQERREFAALYCRVDTSDEVWVLAPTEDVVDGEGVVESGVHSPRKRRG